MKKIVSLIMALLVGIAALAAVTACSEGGTGSQYDKFLQAFEQAGSAQKAVKDVRVSRGEDLLRSRAEEYTLAEGRYTVVTTTRVRNQIGAGAEFSEDVSTQTVDAANIQFGGFPAESELSEIVYSGDLVLAAKIADAAAVGLAAEDVDGEISFSAELKEEKLTEAEIAYMAPSGNSVVILLQFTY